MVDFLKSAHIKCPIAYLWLWDMGRVFFFFVQ